MPPALSGSLADRLRESIAFSERARRRAVELGEPVKEQVRRDYRIRDRANRMRTDPKVVEAAADYCANSDDKVKIEVAKEQWGYRLASMYGIARLVEQASVVMNQNHIIIEQNKKIIEQNDRVIDLLGQLVNAVRGVPPPDVLAAGLHDDT